MVGYWYCHTHCWYTIVKVGWLAVGHIVGWATGWSLVGYCKVVMVIGHWPQGQ